jgi:hypothetical protein
MDGPAVIMKFPKLRDHRSELGRILLRDSAVVQRSFCHDLSHAHEYRPRHQGRPANFAISSLRLARHVNIAPVCGAPRRGPARHEHPMQGFVMTRYRKHHLGVMPYLASFTGARKPLISSFPDGQNRRGSMPESSLTEDAEITPDGNVSVASVPAAIGVDVSDIPSRTAGQLALSHPSSSDPKGLGSCGQDEKGSSPIYDHASRLPSPGRLTRQ